MSNGHTPAPPTLEQRVGTLERRTALHDPALPQAIRADTTTPAMPTEGPNRITLHVPQDHVVFSLGDWSATWVTSPGIVGIADTNVHFAVTAHTATTVSLGQAGKGDGLVPEGWLGYNMVTTGHAYHHSVKQHYVTSRTGDVILNSTEGSAVLQSDQGKVEINAGDNVSLKSHAGVILTAKQFTPTPHHYTDLAYTLRDDPAVDVSDVTMAVAEAGQSALDLVLAIFSPLVGANTMAPNTTRSPVKLNVGHGVAAAKLLASIFGLKSLAYSTKAQATNDVALGGNIVAGVGAPLGACVSSALCASLVGCVSAVVAGCAYAAVWGGAMASLRGARRAVVASEQGAVTIASQLGTFVTAAKSLEVVGTSSVQLNGKDAALYGPDVYVGANDKFGLTAGHHGVRLGKIGNAGQLDKPGEDEPFIQVRDGSVKADMPGRKFMYLGAGLGQLVFNNCELKVKDGNGDIRGKSGGRVFLKHC